MHTKMRMITTNLFAFTLLILSCSTSNARNTTSQTLTPAPAPEPEPANITHLLDVAGPFHTFLNYLESTKAINIFQNQAKHTEEGLTLFVPKDPSFSFIKKSSLSNLTDDQLKQLCLFHALPHYYSLYDFKNLSSVGPVSTIAGGDYTLNFTDISGTIQVSSGWSVTKISSSVLSSPPAAVYQIDKVLLPPGIFGTNIPSTPASPPALEPVTQTPADEPSSDNNEADKEAPPSKDSSGSLRVVASLVLALLGGLCFLFVI